MTAAAPPHQLGAMVAQVDERIRRLLNAEHERWRDVDDSLALPLATLTDLALSGGKRLRPMFCILGHLGAGGDPGDPVIVDVGAALELLHVFALIHDDVMDGSATRRGNPTAHDRFADLHSVQGWRGEGRRFGEGVAILLGDLSFVYADALIAEAPREALQVFTEMRIEVNIGQYLDLLGTARGIPDLERARRICTYKSGKYTIERPLHLGAAVAGKLSELELPLSAYGLPLGEAFQLRDDLLGAFGDTRITGKPVGDDLREGKPTALLAIASDQANAAQREVLRQAGGPGLTPEDIARMQQVLLDTGAASHVELRIEALRDEAIAAVRAAHLLQGADELLVEMADFVTARHF